MKDVITQYLESANFKLEQDDSIDILLSKLLMAENDAIVDYNLAIKIVENVKAKEIFQEILEDERKHAEQLRGLQLALVSGQDEVVRDAIEENEEAGKSGHLF